MTNHVQWSLSLLDARSLIDNIEHRM